MMLRWRIRGLSDAKYGDWQTASFGDQLQLVLSGPLGAASLSSAALEVLTVGLAVFSIERSLPGYFGTNRTAAFEVELGVEDPDRWTKAAIDALVSLLSFQGDATWHWSFDKIKRISSVVSDATTPDKRSIDRVVLFSGGLDSTSGISTLRSSAKSIQLVSHYSKQKSSQLAIAEALGYEPPTQARVVRRELGRRGRTFLYRSFYFLCFGAAVASSYKVKKITQFENGLLATAIPPSPAYFMTRHAHPAVHRFAEVIFSEILGGTWSIDNPFLSCTKRDCVDAMRKEVGPKLSADLIKRTDTCWYTNSYQLRANRKKDNGVPCGICIPCLIRRTALRAAEGFYDLRKSAVRSDPVLAREFDAYSQFVVWIEKNRSKPNRLWLEMPTYVRQVSEGNRPLLPRNQLIGLLERFAREFRAAF
jgi:7-cyano-7-deazaguanine synthase in queuosine biosynthesis